MKKPSGGARQAATLRVIVTSGDAPTRLGSSIDMRASTDAAVVGGSNPLGFAVLQDRKSRVLVKCENQ
jgi:hypothetical protein